MLQGCYLLEAHQHVSRIQHIEAVVGQDFVLEERINFGFGLQSSRNDVLSISGVESASCFCLRCIDSKISCGVIQMPYMIFTNSRQESATDQFVSLLIGKQPDGGLRIQTWHLAKPLLHFLVGMLNYRFLIHINILNHCRRSLPFLIPCHGQIACINASYFP